MNDRELLELAAKAAGIKVNKVRQAERDASGVTGAGLWTTTCTNWDPENNNGDSMRLAAALGMTVDFGYTGAGPDLPNCVAVYLKGGERRYSEHWCGTFNDTAKNARAAILSAAARVGKEMP